MEQKKTTNEDWTILFGSLGFDKKIPFLLQQCKKRSYDIYVIAKYMNESIERTGDLKTSRQEILKKFFS